MPHGPAARGVVGAVVVSATPDYLKTAEVAEIIRKSPSAVRKMRHRGLGPKGTRIGRDVLYDRADVNEWLRRIAESDDLAQRAC